MSQEHTPIEGGGRQVRPLPDPVIIGYDEKADRVETNIEQTAAAHGCGSARTTTLQPGRL